MKKVMVYILMILISGIGMASAKLIFNPLFKNQEVILEGLFYFLFGDVLQA